jgi:hypothetical protein
VSDASNGTSITGIVGNIGPTPTWIGLPVTVTPSSGQGVWVSGDTTIKSLYPTTDAWAYVALCSDNGSGTLTRLGWTDHLVETGTSSGVSIPISVTSGFNGYGTFKVGLCQHDASTNARFWGDNVTALVYASGS